MLDDVALKAIAGHLAEVLGTNEIEIDHVKRFHGGASRETYALDIRADGEVQSLILRKDPPDSLIETDRRVEFAALKSCEGLGLPVPRAISLVEDAAMIGAPFFVMERIEGGEAVGAMDPTAYGDHKAEIGAQFFGLLGRVHGVDTIESPLAAALDVPDVSTCWSRELDYWADVIAREAAEPEPYAQAAIRWLRRNPPPPAQRLSIVHGDYRNGNVLHDGQGRIVAILDWEMAHIGDPLEDLAWALDPMWNLRDATRAAGLIAREEAFALWERASGCIFDEGAFRWWEMFATLKGLGIWISSARAYAGGANSDPILAFSGWFPKVEAHRLIAERLAP